MTATIAADRVHLDPVQLPGLGDVGPDLADYDVILVNTSAGKDSQAMIDVIVEQTDAAGVPRSRLVAFHADLGRVEWPGTAELAQEHADHYGLRLVKLGHTRLDLLARIEERGAFPDAARRWCTSDFKRGPGRRAMTMLVAERRNRAGWVRNPDGTYAKRQVRILNCMGFRRQESPARAKKLTLRHDEPASNGKRHVDEWSPILGWSLEDVWARIFAVGTRHHPAYDAGMPRLSCSFCVLASRGALVRAAQLRPELAAEYAAVEVRIGHRFRQNLSMADIIDAAAAKPPVGAIADWVA